jgi:hypothetical protein
VSSAEPRPAVARPGPVVPAALRAEYAASRWTQVSDYADQSTWQLDRPGRSTVLLNAARSGTYPGLRAEVARTRWAADRLPVPEVIAAADELPDDVARGREDGWPAGRVRSHDLRHTGNTWAADSGANPRELMERMGHSRARRRWSTCTRRENRPSCQIRARFPCLA